MAIIITDECINCGACEPECPNTAIYEAAVNWKYSDGTNLSGEVNLLDGKIVNAELPQRAVNDEVYYTFKSISTSDTQELYEGNDEAYHVFKNLNRTQKLYEGMIEVLGHLKTDVIY